MITSLVLVICLVAVPATAIEERHAGEHPPHTEETHDDHGDQSPEVSSNVGPGKAVQAADPRKGFQLSSAAMQRIGFKTQPVRGGSPMTLPVGALVRYREVRAVYRLRDGWIARIEGQAQTEGQTIRFAPKDIRALVTGDAIVIEDVPTVRLAELDAFSAGEEGHGH